MSLREHEDDKADIIHKYHTGEAAQLIRLGKIPDRGTLLLALIRSMICAQKRALYNTSVAVDLCYSGSGVQEFEEEDDGFRVDFDVFGVMRDQDTYRRIRSTGMLNYGNEDVSHKLLLSHNM